MRYSSLIVMLILLQSLSVNSNPIDEDFATFEYYDEAGSIWYNLTISDHYSINSDIEFYKNLELEFGINPWDKINEEIENSDFYNINQAQLENPIIILHITQGDKENTIYFANSNIPTITPTYSIIDHFQKLMARLLGSFEYLNYIWVYDYSLFIMESYPEQYGFSANVIRGNDWLDVVYESNVTLIVSDYDFQAYYIQNPNGTILYKETKLIELDYGGETKQVSFSTFSVPTDFRPDDLYFTVIIDNEFSFMIYPNGVDILIRTQNIDPSQFPVSDFNMDGSSDELDLPIDNRIILFSLIIIPILKKLYHKSI